MKWSLNTKCDQSDWAVSGPIKWQFIWRCSTGVFAELYLLGLKIQVWIRAGSLMFFSLWEQTLYVFLYPIRLHMLAHVFHLCSERQWTCDTGESGVHRQAFVWRCAARLCLLWPAPVVNTSLEPSANLLSHQQCPALLYSPTLLALPGQGWTHWRISWARRTAETPAKRTPCYKCTGFDVQVYLL